MEKYDSFKQKLEKNYFLSESDAQMGADFFLFKDSYEPSSISRFLRFYESFAGYARMSKNTDIFRTSLNLFFYFENRNFNSDFACNYISNLRRVCNSKTTHLALGNSLFELAESLVDTGISFHSIEKMVLSYSNFSDRNEFVSDFTEIICNTVHSFPTDDLLEELAVNIIPYVKNEEYKKLQSEFDFDMMILEKQDGIVKYFEMFKQWFYYRFLSEGYSSEDIFNLVIEKENSKK
ncbi:hypothetical protein JXM83_05785 [Candidatus Woesearchaeota archaeon]|nr:hypothetical protein [Candidatus Woesearchaeota archaeon]